MDCMKQKKIRMSYDLWLNKKKWNRNNMLMGESESENLDRKEPV